MAHDHKPLGPVMIITLIVAELTLIFGCIPVMINLFSPERDFGLFVAYLFLGIFMAIPNAALISVLMDLRKEKKLQNSSGSETK